MVKIYHYTNYDGKVAIEQSGFLKMSKVKVGDAMYGDGVYFTSMRPLESTEYLIMNNWGINPESDRDKDILIPVYVANTEWFFEFDSSILPSAEPHIDPNKFPELGIVFYRDIWVYPNRDLPIGNIKTQRRDTKGFGINVERGIIRNLTNAEKLLNDSRLRIPRPFIQVVDSNNTAVAVVRIVTLKLSNNDDDEEDKEFSSCTSSNNRIKPNGNLTTPSQGQDGKVPRPVVGMKKVHQQRNSSNSMKAKTGIQKTCQVFHSVQVAEQIEKRKNSSHKNIWKRLKRIFPRVGKSVLSRENVDEIDTQNDKNDQEFCEKKIKENLCFLCFMYAFCV